MTERTLDGAARFDLPGGGRALFTTRACGNLSTLRGDDRERGGQARESLREALDLRRLCATRQVHGVEVQRVRAGDLEDGRLITSDADGQVTALSGVGAMVLTADCLPVALGCDGAVAMLHAGWRGLAAGVLEAGVRALRDVGGRDRIVAVIGPGAGVCCYEVGPEVHAAFAEADRGAEPGRGDEADRGGGASRNGTHIDLRAIARERLLGAGVAEVLDVPACTICDERFFSHRREGVRAGRQAGVAWLS